MFSRQLRRQKISSLQPRTLSPHSRHLSTALLEVERKFRSFTFPSGDLTQTGTGNPPFKSIKPLGETTFRDIYYDSQDHSLIRSGIYIRERSGRWEAKIRQGGDYNNSQFEELHDTESIGHLIQRTLNTKSSSLTGKPNFGLECLADITTHRKQWRVDDEFSVMLDKTQFGHTVGEVELQNHLTFKDDMEKNELIHAMDRRIVEFLERYKWAFTPGEPKGKLTAYFELKKAGLIT